MPPPSAQLNQPEAPTVPTTTNGVRAFRVTGLEGEATIDIALLAGMAAGLCTTLFKVPRDVALSTTNESNACRLRHTNYYIVTLLMSIMIL